MTEPEALRTRFEELHRSLDVLLAAYLHAHPGALPSRATIGELLVWNYRQTIDPAEPPARRPVDVAIDWSQYPRLAAIFAERPQENVYWRELRALLADVHAQGARDGFAEGPNR